MVMFALLAVMALGARTAVPVPSDWVPGVRASRMLYAATPTPSSLLPTIENGFIGGDVGCSGGSGGSAGALHLAGLYSGGSHTDSRAGLPNPLAAQPVTRLDGVEREAVPGQPLEFRGAALDLGVGTYFERWALPQCGSSAILESRRYAHRQHRALLAWRMRTINASRSCMVTLSSCTRPPSGMIPKGSGQYEVADPEQPADPSFPLRQPALVAIASNLAVEPGTAWNLSIGPAVDHLFLAVVRSTLEADVNASNAMAMARAELKSHEAAGADKLERTNAMAWGDVYGTRTTASKGGSIHLEGNPQLAAYINSSLYYLLCSVRDDWPAGISEGGIGSEAYRGMMFWSDGVMDGPLLAAINAPIADALLQYRTDRLQAAKSIAKLNGYKGAYWPWQSGVTGFERSCGNNSLVMKVPPPKHRKGCYWMHEIHISADVALYFRLNYYRTGANKTFLRNTVWPVVSATADFFASRVNRSNHPSRNWTLLNVIGPDEHSYITNSNTYTNAAAGQVMAFAAWTADTLHLKPASLSRWKSLAGSMLVPTQKYCLTWPNASTTGCPPSELVTIHPQYDGYHGQDINQADVALLQWPLHLPMDKKIARADLAYYAMRSSGADTKGFYTGDSSYAIAMLFNGEHSAAQKQLAFAFDHQIGDFNIWTETNPKVAAHNSTGNLNFLTGAGGFLENIVFGYGGLHYTPQGLSINASLPPYNVSRLTFRGLAFAHGTLYLQVNGSHQMLARTAGRPLMVHSGSRSATALAEWPAVTTLPRGRVQLSCASSMGRTLE